MAKSAAYGNAETKKALLKLLADGKEHSLVEAVEFVARELRIPKDERERLQASGKETVLQNRTRWGRWELQREGIVETTRRGFFRLVPNGKRKKLLPKTEEVADGRTPDERLSELQRLAEDQLFSDLADAIKDISPSDFEKLVAHLLVAMGYAKEPKEIIESYVVGRSGDGGIDVKLPGDPLGVTNTFVQIKHSATDRVIDPGDLRDFKGALIEFQSSTGIFVTNSRISDQGRTKLVRGHIRVRVIEGQELLQLLLKYNVGVIAKQTFILKQVDENFFPQAKG